MRGCTPEVQLTLAAFYSFFVFGFIDNLRGPTLPALLDDLGLSYSQGGWILFASSLGFMLATLLAGILADVAGHRTVLACAGGCAAVGVLTFSHARSVGTLLATIAVVGVGMGAIEVSANTLIAQLHRTRRGRFLNLLALFHGVGSLVVPLYAAQLLAQGTSWRVAYRCSAVLAVVLSAYFLLLRPSRRLATARHGDMNWAVFYRLGVSRRMICHYVMIGSYVAAEIGIGAWMVEFLHQAKELSISRSSLYLSFYFLLITAGRLVGSVLAERIGYLRLIFVATCCAQLTLAGAIFGPPGAAILLPVTGLCFSIVFPMITADVAARHTENTGTLLGILFAFAGLGGMMGPWTIGLVADLADIQWGMALSIVYCAVVVAGAVALRYLR